MDMDTDVTLCAVRDHCAHMRAYFAEQEAAEAAAAAAAAPSDSEEPAPDYDDAGAEDAASERSDSSHHPVPNRGGMRANKIIMCTLCPAAYGIECPVAVSYLGHHLAHWHKRTAQDEPYPAEMRYPLALYKKQQRQRSQQRAAAQRAELAALQDLPPMILPSNLPLPLDHPGLDSDDQEPGAGATVRVVTPTPGVSTWFLFAL